MTEKKYDRRNRWRCKTVSFNVSPEEAQRIDMEVQTSGLKKQDFILKRLLNQPVIVYPNIRVQKYLGQYLEKLTQELSNVNVKQPEEICDILENIQYLLEMILKTQDAH